MFCEENRITREVFWSGFGFQVWCQLLTHFLINKDTDLLVVDEPDIYLHPNHQRQILHLLRVIYPNILLATHSTEMIGEADPSELILVNKAHRKAHRLVNIHEVQTTLDMLGSSQNLTLTQLARTGKVLFVEGTDFRIIGRIASVLGIMDVANQLNFTVVPVDGFAQWEKIQALGWGFEKTLGQSISMAAVFDKDFRCDEEVSDIVKSLQKSLEISHIHSRKEIENYLLIPDALDIALKRRYKERSKVSEKEIPEVSPVREILQEITEYLKNDLQAQYIAHRIKHFESIRSHLDTSTITKETIEIFDKKWEDIDKRVEIVPGKRVFSDLNAFLQENYGFNLTPIMVMNSMRADEIPDDLASFIRRLNRFQTA